MLYATLAGLLFLTQNPQVPPGQQLPPSVQSPGGVQQPVTGQNVVADGIYQILAYEKFGQVLPGMNTLKVAIRNGILIFPGDGKLPGKMIQLSFGPNNTITLTPIDARSTTGTTPPNTTAPVNTDQNPAAGTNTGNANSESGVYVLSAEFFSISVVGTQPVNSTQPVNGTMPNQGVPPVAGNNPVATAPAGTKGTAPMQQGGFIYNPKTGGTDAPGQPGFPPISRGGQTPPTIPGIGQGGVIRDPKTGGTDAPGQPGTPLPTSGGTTQSSAVLVLRRIVN